MFIVSVISALCIVLSQMPTAEIIVRFIILPAISQVFGWVLRKIWGAIQNRLTRSSSPPKKDALKSKYRLKKKKPVAPVSAKVQE